MTENERSDVVAVTRAIITEYGGEPTVSTPASEVVHLPAVVRKVLHDETTLLIAGEAIDIVKVPHELTVAQVADVLDEDPEDMEMLIEGAPPDHRRSVSFSCQTRGCHRVPASEREQRRAAIKELLQLRQEMGEYATSSKT